MEAYRKVFESQGYKVEDLFTAPEYNTLFEQTNSIFDGVINTEVSGVMQDYLRQDSFIFSALKTDLQLREAQSYLTDEKGNVRSFHSFEQQVKKTNVQYNKRYLEAEYDFAVHSAQSAEQWQEFSDDTSRYLLEYRTAGDEKVRDSHASLNGTKLPKDDPFWDEYMPPTGWNCFEPKTKVLTPTGWSNIDAVGQYDSLIGGSGNIKLVEGVHINPFNGYLIQLFAKREFISCTPNHRFITQNGWCSAETIKRGDIIVQVGKCGFFNKIGNAINNTITIFKYAFMAFVR